MVNKKSTSKKESKTRPSKGPVIFDENIEKIETLKEEESHKMETSSEVATSTYMIKLVLIGDAQVGKTSIRKMYLGEGFPKEHLATLGADFAVTTKVVENHTIKYQIWDLAGQPMFKNVRPRFFKGCFGALLVFDITREDTFKNLSSWLDELYRDSGRGVVPAIILANKTDLVDDQVVSIEEVKEFVENLNKKTKTHRVENFFLETSAKTGLNIEKAFEIIGHYIINSFGK